MAILRAFLLVILVLGSLSNVEAQSSKVLSVKYMTSANGAACGPPNVVCDGGFERKMDANNGALNVIPQVADVILEYTGTLGANKYISLVDQTINGGNPCTGGYAAAAADSLHSGAQLATGSVVTIPQKDNANPPQNLFLDGTRYFTVCYAEGDGTGNDATWASSGITLRVAKITALNVYGRNFKTTGVIPYHSTLKLHYIGTVLEERWISLVEANLQSGNPCSSGAEAAAPTDLYHSGSRAAESGSKTILLDTTALSSSHTFAVCYTESGGITSSLWRDSGIRLKRAKAYKAEYGVDAARFGTGFARESTNRNRADYDPTPTDKFPRFANAKLKYGGELAASKWVSLVDASLMNNNPCAYPQVAAAAANSGGSADNRLHTGAVQADAGSIATFPQAAGNLLDYTKRFALCYAEVDGTATDTTWADTYVRYDISRLESVVHHGAKHATGGHLPNTGSATDPLRLAYEGSFVTGNGAGTVKIALVDASTNAQTDTYNTDPTAPSKTYSVTTRRPCDGGGDKNHAGVAYPQTNTAKITASSTESTGGVAVDDTTTIAPVDTTGLNTGLINTGPPATLSQRYYAICYTSNSATDSNWRDSGIRVTISKMKYITYGVPIPTGSDTPRVMKPVTPTMLLNGLAAAANVISQVANQDVAYVSTGIQGTPLGNDRFVALVDASINSNKPCVRGVDAAAASDAQHSGVMSPASGTSTVTVPQTTLLQATGMFAICYAITSGTTTDTTWADSYVRVTVSKVKHITSMNIQHRVSTYVGHIAHRNPTDMLDVTYDGTMAENSWMALIDDSLGTNPNFPCHGALQAQGTQSTGVSRSPASPDPKPKTVLFYTSALLTTKTYAACYSEDNSVYYDSGIRMKISEISSLQTSSGYDYYVRDQVSVFLPTNRLAQVANQKFEYIDGGTIGNDKHFSLVGITLNSGYPCANPNVAAGAAAATGTSGNRLVSGVAQARRGSGAAGGKVVTVPQLNADTLLDTSAEFTVCYSKDGGTTANTWQDTYIHFKITKLRHISQNIGKWTQGTCLNGQAGCDATSRIAGQTLMHITVGQLPQMQAGDVGLDITYSGSLAASKYVSLVDQTLNPTVVHGITYPSPCLAASASASVDSTHSGVHQASSSSVINTLDTHPLDTSVTFALCYAETSGASNDASWADSGIRLTISKIKELLTASRHTGISNRVATSVYKQTNRVPNSPNNELTYTGTLAAGRFVSLVDASLNSGNPCVTRSTVGQTTTAITAVGTLYSGAITATANKIVIPQSSAPFRLNPAKVFAVCYSESGVTNADAWYDSYIRFGISEIESLTVGQITLVTTGQIPNTAAGYRFTYNVAAGVEDGKKFSLVDASANTEVPCGASYAAAIPLLGSYSTTVGWNQLSSWSDKDKYSGTHTATTKDIKSLDTQYLDTSKTFALCYTCASCAGDPSDTSWQDSGIRLTVPKVHNLEFSSGYAGPTNKDDTKPRAQTSLPLVTNKLPQQANQQLKYIGSLAVDKYISIVDATLNPSTSPRVASVPGGQSAGSNPCEDPTVAAAPADGQHSGAVKAVGSVITIPQSTLLDAQRTFAACYAEGDGSTTDLTWKDTYIRLTITQITKLKIITPLIDYATMTNSLSDNVISINTVGQIPIQEAAKQVSYEYEGTLGNNDFIALSEANFNPLVDSFTGQTVNNPCTPAAASTGAGLNPLVGDPTHSAPHQAGVTDKIITTLDSRGLSTTIDFALCYSYGTNAGLANGNWYDSGIRVTVSALTSVAYQYSPAANWIAERIRTMTSQHTAESVLPQSPNVVLHYAGALVAAKYLSIVDASLNNHNPCVNPAIAGAAQSTTTSGTMTAVAASKDVTVLQNTHLLNATKTFTVCYALTDGGTTDVTWRDSYIRMRITKVTSITSYLVTHFTTGQLPSHESMKIDYFGSLPKTKHLSIVYVGASAVDMGLVNVKMPCMDASHAGRAADTTHSGAATAGTHNTCTQYKYSSPTPPVSLCDNNGDGVYLETCALGSRCNSNNPDNGGCGDKGVCAGEKTLGLDTRSLTIDYVTGAERYYAVCYTDGASAGTTNAWFDSGIRVTFPEITNMQADSGYYTPPQNPQTISGQTYYGGTPRRDQKSWAQRSGMAVVETPTNRLAMSLNQQMIYKAVNPTQFGTSKYFSVVATAVNTNNPCVRPADAAASADSTHSGPIQADTLTIGGDDTLLTGVTVKIPQNIRLDAGQTFSVCYATGSGDTSDASWRDSYVRLKMSKVETLVTLGVSHRTTGQIPNVFMTSGINFEYKGDLAVGKYLSFVDASLNSDLPCIPTQAGLAPPVGDVSFAAWSYKTTHTGAKTKTGQRIISDFNTHWLDTSKTFALCYSEGDGSTSDQTWTDSGIRLKTPKIHTMQTASGVTGPLGKLDTQPRDMTSVPFNINRFPQAANQALTYVGDLGANSYLSLVEWSDQMRGARTFASTALNPCVFPYLAAGGAGQAHPLEGEIQGKRVFSGPTLAVGKTATFSQSPATNFLDAEKTFAVCYSESFGNFSDTTWRDSYVRVKITEVGKLIVKLPHITPGTTSNALTTTEINIVTMGQIPEAAMSQQITYTYEGSLDISKYISLTSDDLNSVVDPISGVTLNNPCGDPTMANPNVVAADPSNNDARHKTNTMSRSKGAAVGSKTVSLLDTTLLRDDKTYALCYSSNGNIFQDSGIRITLPKLDTLNYVGNPASIAARTRAMTSLHLATNKLPRVASVQLTYAGGLSTVPGTGIATNKYVSIVAANLNGDNPCVNPAVAAHGADSEHSGVVQASSRTITIPQATLLDTTNVYAACYAETDGTATDMTWRDSYVRMTMSKVSTISSMGVTHLTTGQIANHINLPITYTGSLNAGKFLSLVDASTATVVMGIATYSHPCTLASSAYATADSQHATATNGNAAGKTVNIDTTNLDSSPIPQGGALEHAARYFAVCYTDLTNANTNAWVDSGVRVTVPEFVDFLVSGGYTGSITRHQTSELLATNVIAQAGSQALTYVVHSTSNGCKDPVNGNPDPNCALGNAKYISLVAAELNGFNPCVIGSVAAQVAGTDSSGPATATAGSKDVSIDATNLDATKTFAVCYSKGAALWNQGANAASDGTTNDVYWRDSYVRLKVSKIDTITTIGVNHKTYGQVPNTKPADKLSFTYSGTLSNGAYLSLVDASLNNEQPCVGSHAGVILADSTHSGSQAAGTNDKVVSSFDTGVLTTSPGLSKMHVATVTTTGYWYALCYAETGGTTTSTWVDSGIRVSMTKVYSAQAGSGHVGTPPRDQTSSPLATNRLPGANGQELTYVGDLAVNKYLSLVDASYNNNNPCVDANEAAKPTGTRYSGPLQAPANSRTVTVAATGLDAQNAGADIVYAVCYDDGAGNTASTTWRDSYIRLIITEVSSFATKGVPHTTTGQIPSHKAGLVYTYAGNLAANKHVSLVDASLGPTTITGFAATYPRPCKPTIAAAAADSQHTGKHTGDASKQVNTIDTTTLDSFKTFALCYAVGVGTAGDTSWRDSGIRVTVPLLTSIKFSGMLEHLAAAEGKSTRIITSIEAALQSIGQEVPTVLTSMQNLPIVYAGALPVSQYVSIVDVTMNSNNPCVDPTIAAGASSSQQSGPVRGCKSFAGLCLANGDSGTTAGNKEVVFPLPVELDGSKKFTVCYSTGDGSGTDYQWRDSYIRITMSRVTSVTATLVTHVDFGHIASHEQAVPLPMTYTGRAGGTLLNTAWFALVDQTLNGNDPCASAPVAAAVLDTAHSGPFRSVTSAVGLATSHLDATKIFVLCYSEEGTNLAGTVRQVGQKWYSTGIRFTVPKLHTVNYNLGQLPSTRTIRNSGTNVAVTGLPKFRKSLTSSRAKIGFPVCSTTFGQQGATCDGPTPDGVFNDACQVGFLCDPDAPRNGGCGSLGTCSEQIGPDPSYKTLYNNQILHKLPQVAPDSCVSVGADALNTCDNNYDGSFVEQCMVGSYCDPTKTNSGGCGTGGSCSAFTVEMKYVGNLLGSKYISFVDASGNNNDPCVLGSLAAASASSVSTGVVTTSATKGISLTRALLKDLDPSKTFALCYAENNGAVGDAWRDSYLRFTISKIEAITHHGVKHFTQGHIPNDEKVTLTYRGDLLGTKYVSLVDETANGGAPCASGTSAAAATTSDGLSSGAKLSGGPLGKDVVVDTRRLNTGKNFAVCYTEGDGTATASWKDSGVRVTVSRMSKMTYNAEQEGTTVSEYVRNMLSTNSAPASNFLPLATNVVPKKANSIYSYAGNEFATGTVAADASIGVQNYVAFVDSTLNGGNPCADTDVASAAPSTQNSGSIVAATGTKTVTVPQTTLLTAAQVTVCYAYSTNADTKGTFRDFTWRDSYVRLSVSKIATIQAYGIVHTTFGDIPSNGGLTITSDGNFAVNGKISLVDESLNAYQPCTAPLHAGKTPDSSTQQQYTGVSTYNTANKHTLVTNLLNADKTFALCYTEGTNVVATSNTWADSGIRLKTPKVPSITFGSPGRVLTSDSCFTGRPTMTVPNCISNVGGSDAHYNSIIPRAMNVEVTYNAPTYGTGIPNGKHLALIDQEFDNVATGQANNPCRDANAVTKQPFTLGSNNNRLTTGQLTAVASTNKVIIPQMRSVAGALFNYLDASKTFAVCYSAGDGSVSDLGWSDTYVRVVVRKIANIYASGVTIDTWGTVGSAPSLTFRWSGSLGYNQYLKIASMGENSNQPCDKSQAAVAKTARVTTGKGESGSGSEMVTFDTSGLTDTAGGALNGDYFAVCYAEGAGDAVDATWADSGIRLRFIRWTSYGKSRVASGAPSRMTFNMNLGRFNTDYDKVVLLQGASNCANAPNAPAVATDSSVARIMDYTCATVGGGNVGTNCDTDFDGVSGETCSVGALCDPANLNNGGCGDAGTCVGTIQLPTGASYAAVHDASQHVEARLGEGNYAICVCLGAPPSQQSAHPTGYGFAHGDGGCNSANEFTSITSPVLPGSTFKVVSEPRLGRFLEAYPPGGVRHVQGMSHKYNIKAGSTGAGFQLANGDKIYFVPAAVGCGQRTKYSGEGSHVYDHATNSYVSSNVDRRWRALARTICTAVSPTAAQNCDTNNDGVYVEPCAVNAFCDLTNANNGGCGQTGGVCATPIPGADASDRTAPISVTDYDGATMAGVVTTPTGTTLSTVGSYVSCFATAESLTGVSDVTDYVRLADALEVIVPPRLGPISSPGDVRVIETSSPSFAVNTMKLGDMIYFVPRTQTSSVNTPATTSDCSPYVCVLSGGSGIGNNCDTSYSGQYTDTCAYRARCNPVNPFKGGCGTAGQCGQIVPTVSTSQFTGLIAGSGFTSTTGEVSLPTNTKLQVPPYISSTGAALSAWYLAACFVPAGAITSLNLNVKPLEDMLTVLKEPTDNLVTRWFQSNVQELRFTQPQQGTFGTPEFSAGMAGDIVVLQKDSCTGVHAITASAFVLGQTYSAKFSLEEAGGETAGDEKGGTASVYPLAQGKVNELPPGVYKICYATKNSGGESQTDFKELGKAVEILPPTATTPELTVPRTVMLGQDVVISWKANIGLQSRLAPPGTWVGLYSAGDCTEGTEWRHSCYKAFQFVEPGNEFGTVRFSQSDYKIAGNYDVRFFEGDSRNKHGSLCKGLTGVPSETYVSCMFEPAITSSQIHIHGPDMRDLEDLDSQQGLEVVFAGNRGRFN